MKLAERLQRKKMLSSRQAESHEPKISALVHSEGGEDIEARDGEDSVTKTVHMAKADKKPTVQSRYHVNPLVNIINRLTGEWPLFGPPELTEAQYRALYSSEPAFVDYFPVVGYLDEEEAYLLEDEINVCKIWRVETRYMCAKSNETLADFNLQLTQALNALPTDDENPYIVQVFAQKQERNSIVSDIEAAMRENNVLDDPLSQAVLEVNRRHAELVSHPRGIFPDSRLTGSDQGWRVGEQAVYLCIYRKASERFWKKQKRSPAQQLQYDLSAFSTMMKNAQILLRPLLPHELVSWLAPYFGHVEMDAETMANCRQTASFDLGQKIFYHQPQYHFSSEERERGIYRFGDAWLRYLTIGGIDRVPRDGAITLGEQFSQGKELNIGASIFEQLPVGSMMAWNIIPQSDFAMKNEINAILYQSQDGASREAKLATEQAEEVHNEMLRNKHKVFYVQMGVFLKADSLEDLLDATEISIAKIKSSNSVEIINPKYDLISQDSFIRSLPTVYDFAHDRKAALRARKCYTAHLASLLPFYGNKSGSNHPCYVMYTRTGEPFYLNPFHPADRERVAHELFFGPSGSGKSASIVYMTLQSMAINNPRQFIFDYGNSFGLLADYMEKHGKKVKRITLNADSSDVLAPFFETRKALAEARKAQAISDGNRKKKQAADGGTADTSPDAETAPSAIPPNNAVPIALAKAGDETPVPTTDAATAGVDSKATGTQPDDETAVTAPPTDAVMPDEAATGADMGGSTDSNDQERRFYLKEMEIVLRIMVTGGSGQELTQPQVARLQQALIRGLQLSVDEGEPHARPIHIARAMHAMAEEEAKKEGGLKDIALDMRNMADALTSWTVGANGILFNQTATGFDENYDLTVIELGALGSQGNESMLAVAGLSAIYTITALAEKLQGSGRSLEVKIDEAHLWAKVPMLMAGLVTGSKVFRKLNCWLNVITQDISDFTGEAAKILSNAEFWWLMRMSEKEIEEATTVMQLNDELRHLIRFPRKESGRFVEGVSISSTCPETLIRYVPPSLALALGQTDGKEKEARQKLMRKHGISELDAALMIADEIEKTRRAYQAAA